MPKITPLGDSAVIVHVADDFEAAPAKTVASVLHVAEEIRKAAIPGIVDVAPAYTTVAAFFDPLRAIEAGANVESIFDWLGERIHAALSHAGKPKDLPDAAPIEIPVCYDPDFGFDLNDVAGQTRRSAQEIVDLHSDGDYLVNCVGFTPGFPYLSGLPSELVMPRRASPRKEVPPGSVGIGGKQTGVYPLASPGGWNIIGRTPLRLFDSAKNPPALLRAGNRVRFRAIDRAKFEELAR